MMLRPLLLLLLCTSSLLAQTNRYALVIGNATYQFAPLGQVPINDAIAMRDALIQSGFSVDFYTDRNEDQFDKAVSDFGKKVRNTGGTALFYYSGHGVQYNNQNYLVPIGAELTVEQDIKGYCVPVERIVSYLQGTSVNILILDACRAYAINRGTKSLTQGLVAETFESNAAELVIAYATAPGTTATTKGENNQSLYTALLTKYIQTNCLKIEEVFKYTRRDVLLQSNRQQRPEETGSLISDFYFLPPCKDEKKPEQIPPVQPAIETTPVTPTTGLDSDLDGTPDANDPCPNEYGTFNGCPDSDNDGTIDNEDRCPRLKGPANWKGCPDSDGDGLPDHEDDCPYEKGPASKKGCPLPDRDKDGTPDASDVCPDTYGLVALSGCPDRDGDGVADKVDKCPDQKGEKYLQGCPLPDRDKDGVVDSEDDCPLLPGEAQYKGCPAYVPVTIPVKGGTFTMGCTEEQGKDCETRESPAHTVTLADFAIGRTEVTLAQFRSFIEASKYLTDADKSRTSVVWTGSKVKNMQVVNWRCGANGKIRPPNEDTHPVIHVSWNDAVAYCAWLSEITGQKYRLPTEAEWEYAARGGQLSNKTKYAGSNDLDKVGWYDKKSGKTTHPVGQKKPNELGLYDMSGNAWEWCSDWYGAYEDKGQPDLNPTGAKSGRYRVIRGGRWRSDAEDCRATGRGRDWPSNRSDNVGFRLALSSQ